MKKKQYIAPELDLLILEQTDIITVSGGGTTSSGEIGENSGEWDDFENGFTWDD